MATAINWIDAIANFTTDLEKSLGVTELADRLGVPRSTLHGLKKGRLTLGQTENLIDMMGASFDAFYDGRNVSVECAKAHILGRKDYLAEEYRVGLSKPIIAKRIMDIIDTYYDQNITTKIQKYFQIGNTVINSTDNISTFLNRDIIKYLSTHHNFSAKTLGHGAMYLSQQTPTNPQFKTIKKTYNHLLNSIVPKQLDKSWNYSIQKLSHNQLILNAEPSDELRELHKGKIKHSPEDCEYCLAFLSAVPYNQHRYFSDTKETKCLSRGDSFCQYVVNY